jgi:hypothetical protein
MQVRSLFVAYFVIVAFLLGMLTEKVRFSVRRDAVMRRYEQALAEWRAVQLRSEKAAAATIDARRRGAPGLPPLEGHVLPAQDR